jgi:Protein of unknown function (DUF3455)
MLVTKSFYGFILAIALFPANPRVPANLAVPSGNKLFYHVFAKGTQIYRCTRDKSDSNHFSWTFIAPAADLYTHAKYTHSAGKHYAGPTWESTDGSKVVGVKLQQADAPDPNAIPWLLLHSASTTGTGIFIKVTFIQRLNTTGGKAPSASADKAHLGQEVQVPYTAEYLFYRASARHPSGS